MYLSNKHLPRRAVLRGLGATVALPFLDAMAPAGTVWAREAVYSTGLGHGFAMPSRCAEGGRKRSRWMLIPSG
jgi:hypothetical protein